MNICPETGAAALASLAEEQRPTTNEEPKASPPLPASVEEEGMGVALTGVLLCRCFPCFALDLATDARPSSAPPSKEAVSPAHSLQFLNKKNAAAPSSATSAATATPSSEDAPSSIAERPKWATNARRD